MAKQYLYKVKYNFKKKSDPLLRFGFSKYEDDLGEETIFAMPIVLPESGSIFAYLKGALEKIYENATTEEREEDFCNFKFEKVVKVSDKGVPKDGYNLVITDDIRNQLTKAQLCCYNAGEGAWCLFINAPDNIQYYNAITLEESCGEIINELVKAGVIYKVRNRIKK